MKIIPPEEVVKMGSNYFGYFQNTEMYKALTELELNAGLQILVEEWPLKRSNLNSSYLNLSFARLGWEKKFRVRNHQKGKEVFIIRVK